MLVGGAIVSTVAVLAGAGGVSAIFGVKIVRIFAVGALAVDSVAIFGPILGANIQSIELSPTSLNTAIPKFLNNGGDRMIVFQGKMTNENVKFIIKQSRKITTIITGILSIILLIPIVILSILWNWIVLIAILPLVYLVAFAGIPPKNLDIITPTYISITENDMLSENDDNIHAAQSVENVKVVIDHGECYQILFKKAPFSPYFVCQKDLIKQGTIEEFEKIFKNVLVREIKEIEKTGDEGAPL